MNEQLRKRIEDLVGSDDVVVFMKGNRNAPQCGFSAQVVQILDRLIVQYTTVNVLEDPDVREGVKEFSEWPTIPQLYIRGEFQGGCDIVREMYREGELHQALGIERAEPGVPELQITPAALELLQGAQKQHGGGDLHLGIDAMYRHSLGFGPAAGDEVSVDVGGLVVLLDADSAPRAHGLMIDVQQTPQGPRLSIDNPNAPPPVRQISARELESMRADDQPLRLIDVRTSEEQARARIEGGEPYDEELERELATLPADSRIVFYCHTGRRSQIAAQRLAVRGFTNLHNLAGGIDEWSREVDPSVPRY